MAALPDERPIRELALSHGFRSLIALPLAVGADVVGALTIYSDQPHGFEGEPVELLERLAADLAYGLTALRSGVERAQYLVRVEQSLDVLINTMAAAAEYRDPYTAGHQRRVAELCAALASELGLSAEDVRGLCVAAYVHDLGKIAIPAEILSKPGRLTRAEYELVKEHPQIGYDIMKNIVFPWPVQDMLLQHHERLDGSGYPAGLVGEEILLGSRILAVADTFEAMSSHRPYRPGLGPQAALDEITRHSGSLFEPAVVTACVRLVKDRNFQFDRETDGEAFRALRLQLQVSS